MFASDFSWASTTTRSNKLCSLALLPSHFFSQPDSSSFLTNLWVPESNTQHNEDTASQRRQYVEGRKEDAKSKLYLCSFMHSNQSLYMVTTSHRHTTAMQHKAAEWEVKSRRKQAPPQQESGCAGQHQHQDARNTQPCERANRSKQQQG